MKYAGVVVLAGLLASLSQTSAQTPLASLSKEARVGIEVMKVDTHRIEAVVRKDAAVLERLYGDDYVSTDSEGGTWTKSPEIANVGSGVLSLASYKLEDMNARAYGVDTAVVTVVVTGRNTVSGTFQGKDVSGQYRFTDVFVFRNGKWECVAAQVTLITKK